jgi:hypothetical protein
VKKWLESIHGVAVQEPASLMSKENAGAVKNGMVTR